MDSQSSASGGTVTSRDYNEYVPYKGLPTPSLPLWPCPSCGHCPTCGRSGHAVHPSYPLVPYIPYAPTWICTLTPNSR